MYEEQSSYRGIAYESLRKKRTSSRTTTATPTATGTREFVVRWSEVPCRPRGDEPDWILSAYDAEQVWGRSTSVEDYDERMAGNDDLVFERTWYDP